MKPDQTKAIMKKMRQIEVRTRRKVNDTLAGQYHSVFKGRGLDFDEVREYVPGDELRTIDWNVTARAGRPFVKKFTEERELTILLVVDVSASGNFGSAGQSKRELAAEMACVLAFSAIRNNDKVGLILYSDDVEEYLPPKKGRRHVMRVVREILFFEQKGRGTNTVKALDFANNLLRRKAIIFLISDFQFSSDPDAALAGLRRALRQTNSRHDLVALHIQDAREKSLPNVGTLAKSTRPIRTCAPASSRKSPRDSKTSATVFAPRRWTFWNWTPRFPTCRPSNAFSKIGHGDTK
jgi:uncharacterized protein (DUF58 family)